jgi:hypothetical protein
LRTVKAVRFVLDQLVRHAIDMNIVKENPVAKTKLMKAERKIGGDADKAIAPENRRLILGKAAEDGPLQKTVITIMMFAGLRSGDEYCKHKLKNICEFFMNKKSAAPIVTDGRCFYFGIFNFAFSMYRLSFAHLPA